MTNHQINEFHWVMIWMPKMRIVKNAWVLKNRPNRQRESRRILQICRICCKIRRCTPIREKSPNCKTISTASNKSPRHPDPEEESLRHQTLQLIRGMSNKSTEMIDYLVKVVSCIDILVRFENWRNKVWILEKICFWLDILQKLNYREYCIRKLKVYFLGDFRMYFGSSRYRENRIIHVKYLITKSNF